VKSLHGFLEKSQQKLFYKKASKNFFIKKPAKTLLEKARKKKTPLELILKGGLYCFLILISVNVEVFASFFLKS